METFEIGEIAIIYHPDPTPDGKDASSFHGEECKVVGGLELRMWIDGVERFSYEISIPSVCIGPWELATTKVLPYELRKKKPSKEELGSWDEIEKDLKWNPAKELTTN